MISLSSLAALIAASFVKFCSDAKLVVTDDLLVLSRGVDRSLVRQVLQRRPRESDGAVGDLTQIDFRRQRLSSHMNLQDVEPSLLVRKRNWDAAVKAAWSEKCIVENVPAVRSSQYDDAAVAFEAVHFGQDLVQGLLTLVVASAETLVPTAAGPLAADGIDLVDKHDARRILLRLREQVADTRCANANEHLHELRTRCRDERNAGFARHRAREEGFPSSRWAFQEHTARHLRPKLRELLRLLQEVDNLRELELRLIAAGHIIEGHPGIWLHLNLGLGLPEFHWAPHSHSHSAALLCPAAKKEEAAKDQKRKHRPEEASHPLELVLRRRLHREEHPLRLEAVHELKRLVRNQQHAVAVPFGCRDEHLKAKGRKHNALHLPGFQGVVEGGQRPRCVGCESRDRPRHRCRTCPASRAS